MSQSIAEALRGAQDALNAGDFRTATRASSQLIRQFPAYARAHSVLGEAYREQGQHASAKQAYIDALSRHQRSASAYFGLGLVAEDEGSPEHALAFCQVAWELAPGQRQWREPLSRVAMRRYGSDGDLQLSHAALAQMHANASRLRRAVDAYRRALADLPTRIDLKLGMAECLWRMGHDDEAAQLAREALEQFPESAPALAILADVEHRSGNADAADALLRQLRAADPDGAIVAGMLETNPRANRAWLELPADAVPLVSDDVATPVERPRIAPAPDFEYLPSSRVEQPVASLEELEPISVEEFGAPAEITAGQEASGDFDFDSLGIEGDLEPISIEELGGLPEGYQPVDLDALEAPDGLDAMQQAAEAQPFDPATFDFEDFSIPSEAPAAAVAEEPEPALMMDDWLAPVVEQEQEQEQEQEAAAEADAMADAIDMLQQAGGEDAVVHAQAEAVEAIETPEPVDDIAALAASLEGDVAEALARAGEDLAVVDDIEASRPPAAPPGGYTTMLQSLGDEGFSPFDPRARDTSGAGETMPSMEMDDQLLEQSRPSDMASPVESLAANWDSIDDEIRRAVPEGYQPGYTEELRSLDDIGLAPFEIDEEEAEAHGIAPFNPFAVEPGPDSPFAALQSAGAGTAAPDPVVDDDLLGGLEPFALEEFDTIDTARPTVPQTSSWDSGVSAIPSDDDLEALLAFDEPDEEPVEEAMEQETTAETLTAAEPEAAMEAGDDSLAVTEAITARQSSVVDDLLSMAPGHQEASGSGSPDLDQMIEQSYAVTRQLGDQQAAEATAAPAEEAAETAGVDEAPRPPTSELSDTLRPGTEIFHRARLIKQELVAEGVISGDRELFGASTDEPSATQDEDGIGTRHLDDEMDEAVVEAEAGADIELEDEDDAVEFSSARDVATLRAALEITPDDDEMRLWLAEALREQGEMAEAFTEYRWLIRNAPSRHDSVLQALEVCVERDQQPEMAHRLLGDLYRRRGDIGRASAHAKLALQQRQRGVRQR